MALRQTSRVSFARAIRSFSRNRRGSAAVEFAMIAVPFFMMLFAIVETGLVFFAQQGLESATQDTSRLLLTGQAQTAGFSQSQFKNALCANLSTMFDCTNGIYINVTNYSNFGAVAPTTPIDASGNFVNAFSYSPGGSGVITLVQVYYMWPLFVTTLGYNAANVNGHYRLLTATAAFRNEPY
jgi:Flp pilus assembly protein TadG